LGSAGKRRREFKEAEFVLKQLANETGGGPFPTDARELAKIYQGIWDELEPAAIATRRRTRSATARGAGPGGCSAEHHPAPNSTTAHGS
jgi:hypothetical protein